MLVILSGSSGVGKNTVINQLLAMNSSYKLLPTYTTRAMRVNEEQGNPYFFVNETEFMRALAENDLFEHQIVHGKYYGMSKSILKKVYKENVTYLKDIDVLGTISLINSKEMPLDIITFFLTTDSKDDLINRLNDRGEHDIELRLQRYEYEQSLKHLYSYIINNMNMAKTTETIDVIIQNHIKNKYLFPTKRIGSIHEEYVDELAKELLNGTIFEPVLIAIGPMEKGNKKVYIVDGHHRYLASIRAQKNISKQIINVKQIDKLTGADESDWLDLINFIQEHRLPH